MADPMRIQRLEFEFTHHWDKYRQFAKQEPCPVKRALHHFDLAVNKMESLKLAREEEERLIKDAQ